MGDSTACDCILYSVWPLGPVTQWQCRAKSQRYRQTQRVLPVRVQAEEAPVLRLIPSVGAVVWGTPHTADSSTCPAEQLLPGKAPSKVLCTFQTTERKHQCGCVGLDPLSWKLLSCSRWPGLGPGSKDYHSKWKGGILIWLLEPTTWTHMNITLCQAPGTGLEKWPEKWSRVQKLSAERIHFKHSFCFTKLP